MSVSLNPSSALGFHRPLTALVKRSLTISNPNAQAVAFKVKTTAPKLYCVRPNSGRIEPGESVDVAVMLQPMKEEPPLSFKCKDKFLIQSTLVTAEKENLPLADIWNVTDGNDETRVHQQKLRVAFLPPEGQTLEEEEEPGVPPVPPMPSTLNGAPNNFNTAHNGDIHASHAPIPDFTQSQDLSGAAHSSPEGETVPLLRSTSPPPPPEPVDYSAAPHPAPAAVYQEEPSRSGHDASAHARSDVHHPISIPVPVTSLQGPEHNYSNSPTIVNAHVPPLEATSSSQEKDLMAKLSSANAEIERLRALLAAVPSSPPQQPIPIPNELRRRNRTLVDEGSTIVGSGPGSDVGTTTAFMDEGSMQPEGVPLQVVVIIALGIFITTYLFF